MTGPITHVPDTPDDKALFAQIGLPDSSYVAGSMTAVGRIDLTEGVSVAVYAHALHDETYWGANIKAPNHKYGIYTGSGQLADYWPTVLLFATQMLIPTREERVFDAMYRQESRCVEVPILDHEDPKQSLVEIFTRVIDERRYWAFDIKLADAGRGILVSAEGSLAAFWPSVELFAKQMIVLKEVL